MVSTNYTALADESSLNQLGYHLLQQKRIDEAIKVFQLNVQEYPQD